MGSLWRITLCLYYRCDVTHKTGGFQIPVFIDERNGKSFLQVAYREYRSSQHLSKIKMYWLCFRSSYLCKRYLVYKTGGKHLELYECACPWNYPVLWCRWTGLSSASFPHFENNNADSATVFNNLPAEYTERNDKGYCAFWNWKWPTCNMYLNSARTGMKAMIISLCS